MINAMVDVKRNSLKNKQKKTLSLKESAEEEARIKYLFRKYMYYIWLLTSVNWKRGYALVICNHAPPPPGNSGDFDFCPADPC